MIPIFLKHKNHRPPDASSYILVAANGTFLVKNMNTYSSTCMLDASALDLIDQQEGVSLHTGPIPNALVSSVLAFFRRVFLWHGGEAIVILYYSPQTRTFRAEAPPQRVVCYHSRESWAATGDYLEYDACDRPPGFIKFGSIHSHCDAPAFHSATDIRDEKHDDGLHITIGSILHRHPDVSASFVVNGRRFILNPAICIEGFGNYASCEPPSHWLTQVTCMVPRNGKLEAMKISNENNTGIQPVA